MLDFRIVDDGIGMKQETLRQIWSNDQSRIGYGIRNVDERIKLHYGPEYGVVIGSVYGGGTTVNITVPLNMKEESA
jgi:sensor histidine kinase YesM